MKKIIPLNKRILVEPIQEEHKSKSGILIAETAEKPLPSKGKVVAIGPEVTEVEEGSVVLFDKYSPNEFDFEGKKYFIIHEEDVKALYEK